MSSKVHFTKTELFKAGGIFFGNPHRNKIIAIEIIIEKVPFDCSFHFFIQSLFVHYFWHLKTWNEIGFSRLVSYTNKMLFLIKPFFMFAHLTGTHAAKYFSVPMLSLLHVKLGLFSHPKINHTHKFHWSLQWKSRENMT